MSDFVRFNTKEIDDIHHPLFQTKIKTTQDIIHNAFKTEKTMSETINKVVSRGSEYLSYLQEVIDTFDSFRDMTNESEEYSSFLDSTRKSVEIQRQFLMKVIDWKIQMDLMINKQLSKFEINEKEYNKERKVYDSEFNKLIKSKNSLNEQATSLEKGIENATIRFCEEMNATIWNFGQIIQCNGIQFSEIINECISECNKNNTKSIPSKKIILHEATKEVIQLPKNKKGGILVSKGKLGLGTKQYYYIKGKNLILFNEKKGESIVTDILTSLAKPQNDNHSFELITPSQQDIYYTSCFNEMERWIKMFDKVKKDIEYYTDKNDINESINPINITNMIWKIPGNNRCAECGKLEPEWISLNLGIVICLECCGAHRSLGVRISRVKSLLMDKIEGDSINIVKNLGNNFINSIYQTNVHGYLIHENANGSERYNIIHEKYIEKKFIKKECQLNIENEINKGNIQGVEEYIAIYGNQAIKDYYLILATRCNKEDIVSLLLLNGCNVNTQDEQGNTPLHIASKLKNDRIVLILIKHCASLNITNKEKKMPIDIAKDVSYDFGQKILTPDFPRELMTLILDEKDNEYLYSICSE
ncbi:centaurin beta, putative [Entamoeba dispar SAW760]|uniref:Centaurin beta, putative n=1 Tax=Entamoeba dispar (strain ATCC PRA-260 / SAW760) TaxID=370354 RepID=B0EME3_ENTDS|nr:centaurin beta, putative [Entamoeba dispar SAW760]EDR24361.1 centaurin beta, putative [Entamoeba dispar SAW760]|eukprot:EDR24361.1 centaurin beta, putative [Entamoeba dispar SAW760]